jgi:hypothetical protein
MKCGEPELLLRFDSVDSRNLKSRRGFHRELEQRRLTDPDLASHHGRLAAPGPGGVEEPADRLPLSRSNAVPTGPRTARLVDMVEGVKYRCHL